MDESVEKNSPKKFQFKRFLAEHPKQIRIVCIVILVILIIYLIGCFYYNGRFLANTSINGIDVSHQNYSETIDTLESNLLHKELTLTFVDEETEIVDEDDVGITLNSDAPIQSYIDDQNIFLWFVNFFSKNDIEVEDILTYDDEKLTTCISNLEHVDCEQEEPVDAYVNYGDDGFEIVDEVFGTTIINDNLKNIIFNSFSNEVLEVNVVDEGGYQEPQLTASDEIITNLYELANQYCNATITYSTISGDVTLDGDDILEWLSIDESGNYYYDEDEYTACAKEFVSSLASKINLNGKSMTFKGANGTRTVTCKTYGYTLDQDAEVEGLIADILDGKNGTRTPEVSGVQASYSNGGLGYTFVEVDLTNQKAYFVKDGSVVWSSDCVSGLASDADRKTPAGGYYIYFMQRDRTLRGTQQADGSYEYESFVNYWMAFNGGIGLHDASWRSSFGGSIYLTNGSHGCVNLPVSKAAELYSYISYYTPVVCYY
ncbi:MAG: L,D-transpeptidase/peptidoglycan binding protein [Erysipelotrichaceae bacterium]|nr:L,D-transpeptidase/peptidoglycan binding protein [Erysipelotrichaceae bacterium]